MNKSRNSARLDVPLERRTLPSPYLMDSEDFGRWSERFARYMGTPSFLVQMTIFIAAWLGWNAFAPPNFRFDPYTFTFLTLILSLQASYAAPLILLAQNRQDDRDRISSKQDRSRNERSLSDTDFLAREVMAQRQRLAELPTRAYIRQRIDPAFDELTQRLAVIERMLDQVLAKDKDRGTLPEVTP